MKPRRNRAVVVTVTIGLVLGIGSGAMAAFAATTTNAGDRFVAAADWEPPHVTRTVVAKTVGYLTGKIGPGTQFYVYAQIDDGGNPPAGVGTATADVSAFSIGGAAVAMNAGAFSAGGVLYNYRSAARTAIAPMSNGTRFYSLTMADLATPPHSQTQSGFTVVVDGTGPAPVDLTSANRPGGTVGRAEQGDSITYTWSEPIDPGSLVPGWDGGSPTTVTVRLANNGAGDQVRIRGFNGNLDFGTVFLQQNYVSGAGDFDGSSITMLGNSVTIVLGVQSGTSRLVTLATPTTWQASSGAFDAAGNACSNATVTGSGSPRIDF
jgi:hypothetical protein